LKKGKSDVEKILDAAVGEKNRDAYMTAIGYMLNMYFPPSGTQILFCCDLNLEDGVNNGGNGKDFIKQILAQYREVVNVPSRNLDLRKDFQLQRADKDTEVLWFEDLNRNTRMDNFYNFTNEVLIERKHSHPFSIQTKIGVSLQHTIDMEGTSNSRRQIFLLTTEYFSQKKNRMVEEFGQVFSDSWPEKQRLMFNNFIIECCKKYLKVGAIQMGLEKLLEARRKELGGELYNQLTFGKEYTIDGAMDAVGRGNLDGVDRRTFTRNWRKWCINRGGSLVSRESNGHMYYKIDIANSPMVVQQGGRLAAVRKS